jgi:succinate dehydrogenase / fumarate reductase flavoprotein subunit
LQTLFQQCVARDVNFFNEYQVLDVVFEGEGRDRRVAAAIAYELATGDLHVFQTKAILFASGGFGKMFKISSNAHSLTGDGPGLLFRRGLPLEDMEMYQFHPTGIHKLGILLSEAARGEGGILRNGDGERFMERYAPTVKDLAPRDMVSRAELLEIREGRGCGPNKDHILLDLTHLPPEQIDAKLPDITEFVRTYLGIEPKTQPIPIQPTAHYAMGGIPTNVQGEAIWGPGGEVIPGLYAAGECACVSVHGANRLGTNSLLDIVVFGKRGGQSMAAFVKTIDMPDVPEGATDFVRAEVERMKAGTGTENVADIRAVLQEEMMDKASVFRTEDSLSNVEQTIKDLRARYANVSIQDKGNIFNYDLTEALELGYLLEMAECLVVSARARTESRGAHMREDHPLRDDANFMKHTFAYREDDGSIRLEYRPVEGDKYVPMERKY